MYVFYVDCCPPLWPAEPKPLHRYVTVDTTTNSETIITHALLANFTGEKLGNGSKSMKCSDCSDLIDELTKDDNVCFSSILVVYLHVCYWNWMADRIYFAERGVRELNCIPVCTCIFRSLIPSLLLFNMQQVTVEKLQYNKTEDLCYCVMSYVHYHDAVSPAFLEEDYTSQEYSTWVESRYVTVEQRVWQVL